MSLGIRSGVNCTRAACSPSTLPSVSTSRVLASPGAPTNKRMAAGENGGKSLLHHLVLPKNLFVDGGAGLAQLLQRGLRLLFHLAGVKAGGHVHAGSSSWRRIVAAEPTI